MGSTENLQKGIEKPLEDRLRQWVSERLEPGKPNMARVFSGLSIVEPGKEYLLPGYDGQDGHLPKPNGDDLAEANEVSPPLEDVGLAKEVASELLPCLVTTTTTETVVYRRRSEIVDGDERIELPVEGTISESERPAEVVPEKLLLSGKDKLDINSTEWKRFRDGLERLSNPNIEPTGLVDNDLETARWLSSIIPEVLVRGFLNEKPELPDEIVQLVAKAASNLHRVGPLTATNIAMSGVGCMLIGDNPSLIGCQFHRETGEPLTPEAAFYLRIIINAYVEDNSKRVARSFQENKEQVDHRELGFNPKLLPRPFELFIEEARKQGVHPRAIEEVHNGIHRLNCFLECVSLADDDGLIRERLIDAQRVLLHMDAQASGRNQSVLGRIRSSLSGFGDRVKRGISIYAP